MSVIIHPHTFFLLVEGTKKENFPISLLWIYTFVRVNESSLLTFTLHKKIEKKGTKLLLFFAVHKVKRKIGIVSH